MKLHQLQYFVAACEHGGVRSAATVLGLSPTAVGRALTELEESLGTTLIDRHAQGVVPNRAGRALLAHARLVLAQIRQAHDEIGAIRGAQTIKLRIGVAPWFALSLLPRVVARFTEKRPDVSLDIIEMLGVGYAPLHDGSIELAIGLTPSQPEQRRTVVRPLFSYRSAIICRPGHPLVGARSIDALRGQSWVLSRSTDEYSGPLRQLLFSQPMRELFAPAGRNTVMPRVHVARSTLLVISQVEQSDMLGIAPMPMVNSAWLRGRVRTIDIGQALPEMMTSLLTRANGVATPAARQFIDCVSEVCRDPALRADARLAAVFESVAPPGMDPAPAD